MVRVYDRQHIKDGTEWIKDPLHLTSKQLNNLEAKRTRVVFDTSYMEPQELSAVYTLAEQTGIPVVQRTYTIRECEFTGQFNFNDGQYIGSKSGFQHLLDTLFEHIFGSSQEVIDQYALI